MSTLMLVGLSQHIQAVHLGRILAQRGIHDRHSQHPYQHRSCWPTESMCDPRTNVWVVELSNQCAIVVLPKQCATVKLPIYSAVCDSQATHLLSSARQSSYLSTMWSIGREQFAPGSQWRTCQHFCKLVTQALLSESVMQSVYQISHTHYESANAAILRDQDGTEPPSLASD